MSHEQPAVRDDAAVSFYPWGLASKWGFGDGDMLNDLLFDHGYGYMWKQRTEDDFYGFDHRVLIRCVEEFVLPEVAKHHEFEVYKIGTSHNPIRFETLDGVEVCTTSSETAVVLPEAVVVPVSAILAIAADEATKYRGGAPDTNGAGR